MRTTIPTCLAALVLATACGRSEEGGGWTELGATLTEAQNAQSDRAHEARSALFGRLFKTLQASLAERGAAASIGVCAEEAPRIAARVAEDLGVRIGRTSFRLRNPDNGPPDWARPYVERRTPEPVQLAHADGRFATLHPIRLMAPCATCHGPAEEIAPQVREALAEHYPDDRATGFRAGDLRGWFWIEVPARP